MSGRRTLVINGRPLSAKDDQTLLDAALSAGRLIPHDCATGQCNTCRVRVYAGSVSDEGTRLGETVLACRARVAGDAVIEFDEVPDAVRRAGSVTSLVDLTPDIVEVTVVLDEPLLHLPGQYVRVAFSGLPARDYSPTLRSDGSGDRDELIFHIRRQAGGAVSSALHGRITAGSSVRVQGPFGHAYHRLGGGRLVLVSSGVGWAPIWAVARASRIREPTRPMIVIAGARHAHNLYMRSPLAWLRERGATAVLTCSGEDVPGDARPGRTSGYLPKLNASDTVIAAGLPGMVAAIELLAAAGNATCYSDPFHAADPRPAETGFLRRMLGRIAERFEVVR